MINTFVARLKKIHKSWTMWFNAISGSLIVILPSLETSFPQLQDYLPHNLYQYAMAAIIVGNMVLRFKTVKPLEAK